VVLWPQVQHAAVAARSGIYPVQPMGYTASALTMLVIGLLLGYCIVHFGDLLIHHRRFRPVRLRA
jgi:hypothetical protein